MKPAILALSLAAACWGQARYVAFGKFEESASQRQALADADEELQARFAAARDDAALSDPARINRNLIAITDQTPGLVWKGEGAAKKVLTVLWTSWTGYDSLVGSSTVLARDAWVTIVPELKEFCAATPIPADALTLRLEQLIGLPPHNGKTRMVEIWAAPEDVFRPSADPEITDHEAELDFRTSWRYSMTSPDHVAWIENLKSISYGPTGMPWTRLGYTYDWGNPDTHVGLSEFVIRNGATVEIQSVAGTAEYCPPAPPVTAVPVLGAVNAASGAAGQIAPGEFITIAGVALGPEDTHVFFNGIEAALAYASATRLNAIVPPGIAGANTAVLEVEHAGVRSAPVTLPVVSAAPGLFTRDGHALAATNQDGTLNTDASPAARGSVVSVFATGQGLTGASGRPILPVAVTVGGVAVPAGARTVYDGILQVDFRLPAELAPGRAEVLLAVGRSRSMQGPTLALR
jgi:uncharacterized protein (TIGR03437 family)